jgi:histidinol phosphatase-like PHP family hydrolase
VRRNLLYDYDKLINDINQSKSYFENLTLLAGCEAKVLNLNGDLDIPSHIVDSCDRITGVFHSFSYSDKRSYLYALISMLKNPMVDIWGHPTLFAQKNNIDLNIDDLNIILSTCADNNILIELNLKYRIPSYEFVKVALNYDVKFVIGSDAHSIEDMLNIEKIKEIHNWINRIY